MPRFHKMPCKIDQCFRETGTFETNLVFITSPRQIFVAITRHDGWDTGGKMWAAWSRLQCSYSASKCSYSRLNSNN